MNESRRNLLLALEGRMRRAFPSEGELLLLIDNLKRIRNNEQDDLTVARSLESLDTDQELEREVCIEELNEAVRIVLLLKANQERLLTTLCAAAAAGKEG